MPGELKEYTLAEVAMHNGKGGTPTWIVIRDNVYDVTSYMEDHPGGSELITEWAGKDGTKDFDDFGHSSDAMRILRTLQVGVLVQCDQAKNRLASGQKSVSYAESEENLVEKKRSKRRKFILCG
ncbi:cytochrome b5 [Anopheles ziemanni]|uniref:cytochrome b5 n=1 Tax=Anopheles coustani TaxID=139045 RepID=UPI00265832F9|nr:cytochrome b5 [Anopheles coustani]XP_058167445.1 cytochrome b5 [Anopheles ziemanni]